MIFPLRARPKESYREPPRSFGSARDHGKRKHAGCDLYAAAYSDVLAVDDGTVLMYYLFYDGVFALEVKHPCGIVRYGEIALPGIKAGAVVKAGQAIARVGKMAHVEQSMLHFELYSGSAKGPLTDRARPPFLRRADLIDPTAFLDACEVAK
jgi:murein DD-endopeptidase MepM/ murein hydrolase activator NlpD